MEGERTPSDDIIFATQSDTLNSILLWLSNNNGEVWRVPDAFSERKKMNFNSNCDIQSQINHSIEEVTKLLLLTPKVYKVQ